MSVRNRAFRLLYKLHFLLRRNQNWKKQLPILCFHRVHPDYDPITQPLHPDQFKQVLEVLIKQWFFYPLMEWKTALRDPKGIILTFDDALSDFKEHAWPIIQELKLPVTLFVPTESVNTGRKLYNYQAAELLLNGMGTFEYQNRVFTSGSSDLNQYLLFCNLLGKDPNSREPLLESWNKQLKVKERLSVNPMSWLDLKSLVSEGVDIQNHTYAHSLMSGISEELFKSDIERSEQLLFDNLSVKSVFLAYPMGAYTTRLEKLLTEMGILGLGTQNCATGSGDSTLSRFNVSDRTGEELHLRLLGVHQMFKE